MFPRPPLRLSGQSNLFIKTVLKKIPEMKTKHAIFCLLFLSLASCITLVKWRYGITDPKEVTPSNLTSFLERHHYPRRDQFIFNDSLSYCRSLRNSAYRKHLFSHMIFDRRGLPLQRDTTKCQWSGFEVIKGLSPDSVYQGTGGIQLGDILDHIHPIAAGPGQDTLMHPDFTIVVTWAKFLGTYNARLFDLADAVKQNKTARIRLIWLNADMQKSWNLTKEQKLEIK